MKVCPKCAEEVHDKAQVCKFCGHKFGLLQGGQMGCGTGILISVCVLFVIGYCSAPHRSDTSTSSPSPAVQPGTVNQQALDDLLKNQPWSYHTETDAMTSKKTVYALDSSTNSVDFGAPYDGGSTMFIEIRKHPRMGLDAFIQVSKGQTDCSIEGCYVTVRFDDGAPQRFTATEPEDNSIETLFITPTQRFISKLAHSKTAVVEAPFYQEGRRQFTFSTANLHWPPAKGDL